MSLSNFLVTLLTFIAIYSLFGLGLNVKYGFTGLIDFGHVAYFLVGAYVAVFLTLPAETAPNYQGLPGLGLPELLGSLLPFGGALAWLIAVGGGMVAAALLSLLVGIPTLRLREDYLAITALGIATIVNAVFHNERWLFNGAFGVRDVHRPLAGAFPVGFGSFALNYAILGLVSVAVFGYAGYRTYRIVRGIDARPAALATGAVLALVGAVAAVTGGVAGWFPLGTAGGLFAGLVLLGAAVVLGRAAIRESGRVGAVLTLGAAEVFVLWYVALPFVTGGFVDVVTNVLWLFDPNAGPNGGLDYDRFLLLVSVAMLAGAYWWVERTVNSPYGRVLRAVREDEDVPRALGKRTFRYKTQSLMFGSALAGAAGALWAVQLGFIIPDQFAATITFFAFTAVIIGGTANNRGVILGTAVFWIINSGTRFLDDYVPSEYAVQLAASRLILIGALLIVILYYRPEGILGEQEYRMNLPDAPDAEGAGASPARAPDGGGRDG